MLKIKQIILGYFKTTEQCRNTQRREDSPPHADSVVIPYIKGVSDRNKRAVQKCNVTTMSKQHRTIGLILKKTKRSPSRGEDRGRYIQSEVQKLQLYPRRREQTVLEFRDPRTPPRPGREKRVSHTTTCPKYRSRCAS